MEQHAGSTIQPIVFLITASSPIQCHWQTNLYLTDININMHPANTVVKLHSTILFCRQLTTQLQLEFSTIQQRLLIISFSRRNLW